MTHSDTWTNARDNDWDDGVAGNDEPLNSASIALDDLLNDAADIAKTVIECVAVPLREVLAGLPAAISFETWGRAAGPRRRGRRHARRVRAWIRYARGA
jgi:hypothetical protein